MPISAKFGGGDSRGGELRGYYGRWGQGCKDKPLHEISASDTRSTVYYRDETRRFAMQVTPKQRGKFTLNKIKTQRCYVLFGVGFKY